MGSRAHFVIVEGGRVDLRYDHRAAESLTYDVLLDGLDATLTRARGMRALDAADPASWLDDVWGEGAVVLDLDKRRVTWFAWGGMRPALMSYLLERTWEGWTPIWCPEGMHGILTTVGVDPASVLLQPPGNSEPSGDDVTPILEVYREQRDGWWIIDNALVLSVRFEDGSLWSTAAGPLLETVALLRWDLVVDHVRRSRREGRTGAGPDGAWSVAADARNPLSGWPEEGLDVDLPRRRLSWWSHVVVSGASGAFAVGWPGFDVVSLGDDHRRHEQAAKITGIQPCLDVVLRAERDNVVRHPDRLRPARNRVLAEIDDLIENSATSLPPTRCLFTSRGLDPS